MFELTQISSTYEEPVYTEPIWETTTDPVEETTTETATLDGYGTLIDGETALAIATTDATVSDKDATKLAKAEAREAEKLATTDTTTDATKTNNKLVKINNKVDKIIDKADDGTVTTIDDKDAAKITTILDKADKTIVKAIAEFESTISSYTDIERTVSGFSIEREVSGTREDSTSDGTRSSKYLRISTGSEGESSVSAQREVATDSEKEKAVNAKLDNFAETNLLSEVDLEKVSKAALKALELGMGFNLVVEAIDSLKLSIEAIAETLAKTIDPNDTVKSAESLANDIFNVASKALESGVDFGIVADALDSLSQSLEEIAESRAESLKPDATAESAENLSNDVLDAAEINTDTTVLSAERQRELINILNTFTFLQDTESGQNTDRGQSYDLRV